MFLSFFSYDVLGQVLYLIVSIPDLCIFFTFVGLVVNILRLGGLKLIFDYLHTYRFRKGERKSEEKQRLYHSGS